MQQRKAASLHEMEMALQAEGLKLQTGAGLKGLMA
jgi:hypothetical protein